jgi:hypothetical protein
MPNIAKPKSNKGNCHFHPVMRLDLAVIIGELIFAGGLMDRRLFSYLNSGQGAWCRSKDPGERMNRSSDKLLLCKIAQRLSIEQKQRSMVSQTAMIILIIAGKMGLPYYRFPHYLGETYGCASKVAAVST